MVEQMRGDTSEDVAPAPDAWGASGALVAGPAVYLPEHDPYRVYLLSLAPRSQQVACRALERLARLLTAGGQGAGDLDWARVRRGHVVALQAALRRERRVVEGQEVALAPATINFYLATLRGVVKECWRLGHIDAEAYRRVADVDAVRGDRGMRGRALADDEVRRLLRACRADPSVAGRRDAALLAVLYAAGLRRAEVSGLDLPDYRPDDVALRVRHGKGDKARTVYLPVDAIRVLGRWVEERGPRAGAFFLPLNRNGAILWAREGRPARLSPQAIFAILRRRAAAAGLADPFSPHDLRRTYISNLLDRPDVDISTAQQLAGHSQVTTTQRYDRRGERRKREAAAAIALPGADES